LLDDEFILATLHRPSSILPCADYIKIEEKVDTFLVFTTRITFSTCSSPRRSGDRIWLPHERVMLENIFLGGPKTRLSSLKNRFYTADARDPHRISCRRSS
jgi:hypothetical protein